MKARIFAVALSALFVSACSSKPACGPGNCAGCCNAAGSCELGAAFSECGAAGAMCQVCPVGQSCSLGVCRFPNGGSGGGGSIGTGGGFGTGGGTGGGVGTGGGIGTGGGGFGTGGGGTHRPSFFGNIVELGDGSLLFGELLAIQVASGDGGFTELMSVFEHYPSDPYAGYQCSDSSSSGCSWELCFINGGDAGYATGTVAHTGKVTVTSGAHQWVLDDADSGYGVAVSYDFSFAGGDSLSASSVGSEVPSFTAQTVMPETAQLLSPLPNQSQPQLVNRNVSLPISWTGSSQDLMLVLMVSNAEFICKVQPGFTQVTVPPSILSQLPAAAGTLEVLPFRLTTSFAGQWPVNFITENARGAYSAAVQLQ